MDLISILATVILATTIATVVMGFVAYAAFKMRERRNPARAAGLHVSDDPNSTDPVFFDRYMPEDIARLTPPAGDRS